MDERQRKGLVKVSRKGIQFDCPMDQYTTFRAGGRAAALCFVENLSDLREIVAYLRAEGLPYLIIGRGSNLLVKDGGFPGVGLILRGDLATVEKSGKGDRTIHAGGGLSLVELLNTCRREGLEGLEFLAGIPGTVGGAVIMNAGAWGKEIAGVIEGVEMITGQGEPVRKNRAELRFSYRELAVPPGTVIVRASFALKRQAPEIIAERIASHLKERKAKQPLEYPSGGSVFKNPPNDYAGRLIEMAGLKGKQVGGAMISRKHANFIVNTGGATAADILALMELARERVMKDTGVQLETEIRVVGT
ncbi:MAG: UDP-N-acetylmuramate dehydrogenase [Pseudomonadota bacterium]